MASEAQFRMFSDAICVGNRPELAPINNKRVAVIARSQNSNGAWSYTVYDAFDKTSATYTCLESELVPCPPLGFISDSEYMENIIAQTADLRHSPDVCELLKERGIDPQQCLQISLDQGCDIAIDLVLPDGSVVRMDYRLDEITHQATRIEEWETLTSADAETGTNRELQLCRQIVMQPDRFDFDEAVRRHFEERCKK